MSSRSRRSPRRLGLVLESGPLAGSRFTQDEMKEIKEKGK